MDLVLGRMIGLLLVAILVAILTRKLRLPYTVGLVVTGIGLAALHLETGAFLTHSVIFDGILPPLLFEAALTLHWPALRRDLWLVLILSTLGVLIQAIVVALGLFFGLGWAQAPALVFGALIAATDPVAVIALFRDNRVTGRVRLLVESESLFNDGTAAILFAVVLNSVVLGSPSASGILTPVLGLMLTTGGGLVLGLLTGGVALVLAGRIADPLVETALTVVAAYGSFLLAELLGVSPVLATIAAGLVIGTLGLRGRDNPGRFRLSGAFTQHPELVLNFWDFAAFIMNSLVFLLIGLAVAGISFRRLGLIPLILLVALVLAGRALTVYPLCLVFARTRHAVPLAVQHVLFWGGLRGALALALALALPPDLPWRDDILVAGFGVVVFSVVVQGLTMPLLLRRLGFLTPPLGTGPKMPG